MSRFKNNDILLLTGFTKKSPLNFVEFTFYEIINIDKTFHFPTALVEIYSPLFIFDKGFEFNAVLICFWLTCVYISVVLRFS